MHQGKFSFCKFCEYRQLYARPVQILLKVLFTSPHGIQLAAKRCKFQSNLQLFKPLSSLVCATEINVTSANDSPKELRIILFHL